MYPTGPATVEDGEGVGSGIPFVPRAIIWHEIRGMLRAPEVEEVKRLLGTAVIDKNEVRVPLVWFVCVAAGRLWMVGQPAAAGVGVWALCGCCWNSTPVCPLPMGMNSGGCSRCVMAPSLKCYPLLLVD